MDCRRNHSPSRQRRFESEAERCCGRDRHHSDGFYLGLCRLRGDLSLPASATTFRRRAILLCSNDGAASILKSGPEIKNRCTQQGVNGENRASIPKSEPEIKNRCTQEGVNEENLASIPKSSLEIKNRCTQQGLNREILASIPKFGLEIKNRCTQKDVSGEKLASILKSEPEIKNRCTQEDLNRENPAATPKFTPLKSRITESPGSWRSAGGTTILCSDED